MIRLAVEHLELAAKRDLAVRVERVREAVALRSSEWPHEQAPQEGIDGAAVPQGVDVGRHDLDPHRLEPVEVRRLERSIDGVDRVSDHRDRHLRVLRFLLEQRIGQLARQQPERLCDLHLEVVVEEHVEQDEAACLADHREHGIEDLLLVVALAVRVDPARVGQEADVAGGRGLPGVGKSRRHAPVPGSFLRYGTSGQVRARVRALLHSPLVYVSHSRTSSWRAPGKAAFRGQFTYLPHNSLQVCRKSR